MEKIKAGKYSVNTAYAAIAVVAILAGVVLVLNATTVQAVAKGDNVSVYYTGTFTNGTVFDSNVGRAPLNFTVGAGQLITGFDNAVLGMTVGETKNVTIPMNEAYGPVNPAMIVSVALSVFGNSTITPGMTVTRTVNGQYFPGIVRSVNATNATIDFNSPLAGKDLVFKIELASIHKK